VFVEDKCILVVQERKVNIGTVDVIIIEREEVGVDEE
jgi:hypothetical protein